MWLSEKRQIGLPNLEKGEKPLQNVAYERIERHLKDMIKILFVCHGNICRSPMAEYIMKDYIERYSIKDIEVSSCACTSEEIGNDIYPPAKRCLDKHHIKYDRHYARKITNEDYEYYDEIICMDDSNLYRLNRMFDDNGKIRKLLDRDVADPWYSGDFETTYNDLCFGIEDYLKNNEYIEI